MVALLQASLASRGARERPGARGIRLVPAYGMAARHPGATGWCAARQLHVAGRAGTNRVGGGVPVRAAVTGGMRSGIQDVGVFAGYARGGALTAPLTVAFHVTAVVRWVESPPEYNSSMNDPDAAPLVSPLPASGDEAGPILTRMDAAAGPQPSGGPPG